MDLPHSQYRKPSRDERNQLAQSARKEMIYSKISSLIITNHDIFLKWRTSNIHKKMVSLPLGIALSAGGVVAHPRGVILLIAGSRIPQMETGETRANKHVSL